MKLRRPKDRIRITLHLKSEGRLALSSLFRFATETIQAVKRIESAMAPSDRPSDWDIRLLFLDEFSPVAVVDLEPTNPLGLTAADHYVGGLRDIRHSINTVPPEFDYSVLLHAKQSLRVLDDGVSEVVVTSPKRTMRSDEIVVQRVDALLRDTYHEWTTISGTLNVLKWDPKSPTFSIEDPLTGGTIECQFAVEELERVKSALPGRVEVTGRAKIGRDGKPQSIRVDSWESIPSDDALPTLDGLNITNGLGAAEFLWRLRHGE